MIGVILVTHGKMGEGLLKAAETMVGKQDMLGIVSITPHDSLAEISKSCSEMYTKFEQGEGVLILTDILGGTSCNASLQLVKKKTAILTGVNLPMLITALVHRKHRNLKELSRKVLEDGHKALVDARDLFLKRLS
ncbi:MAG: PTS sugar transporter subunit IIA [bacterium]